MLLRDISGAFDGK